MTLYKWFYLLTFTKIYAKEVFKITGNICVTQVSPNFKSYPKSNITAKKYKPLNHTFYYDI